MLKVVSDNLWRVIQKKAQESSHRSAAVAYVTSPELLPLGAGDVLVTDASNESIAAGRTSAAALEKYLDAGVQLYNLGSLHAKVLVLDDWAVVGSANVSRHSAAFYFEAAVLSDRLELVGSAEKLIAILAKRGSPIDRAFVRRVSKIPVVRRGGHGVRASRPSMPSLEPRYWFVSLQTETQYRGNADVVDEVSEQVRRTIRSRTASVDWFWWPRETKFRTGDIVIQCVRPRMKPATTRSVRVLEPGRISRVFQEPTLGAKTFHCVWKRKPQELSWHVFLKAVASAGIPRKFLYNRTTELTQQQYSDLRQKWPGATG